MTDETNENKADEARVDAAEDSSVDTGGISRRDALFIGAATAVGVGAPLALYNKGRTKKPSTPDDEYSADLLVIGTGFAGMFSVITAKKENPDLKIVMVDKGAVGWSGLSPWASDSRPFDPDMYDRDEWHLNTSTNVEWSNDRKWLDIFMDRSIDIFFKLRGLGAHDCRPFERSKIYKQWLADNDVTVVERTMVTSFLKDTKGAIKGAVGFTFDDSKDPCKAVVFKAKGVIMATGAGAYKSPGFPNWGLTFDGDAMAYDVGAYITGKEYHDTHQTFSDYPAAAYEGWVWAQSVTGAYIMVGPPDPISGGLSISGALRAATGGIRRQAGGGPAGEAPGEDTPEHPEKVRNKARYIVDGKPIGFLTTPDLTIDWGGPPEGSSNLDMGFRVGGSTAGMGVHKGEGVWSTGYDCKVDNLEGIWAAGDSLASMLCGASYPGRGFSSYGSAIQGEIAAVEAVKYVATQSDPVLDQNYLREKIDEMWAPRDVAQGYSPDWVTATMQNTMTPLHILYIKSEERLKGALAAIEYMRKQYVPNLIARDGHELRLAHETKNMLLNAEMKLRAGLYRTESRGTHFREDYPFRDDDNFLAYVLMRKGDDGEMKMSKVEMPEYSKPPKDMAYRDRYPRVFPGEDEYLAKRSRT